ncbi:MAG: SRPBCC family protein [Chloroflexota bacterium]|nr:SRPBCC family protein [Chloroflexota bacterium]
MSNMQIEVSADIDAPPAAVYAIISDYHVGHPAILPKAYFQDLQVITGGTGVGTTIRFTMNVMGMKRPGELSVTDAEPGRLLKEESPDGRIVTFFRFVALDGGARTRITFDTTMRSSGGLMGVVERLTTPGFLRRVYREELALLADYARKPSFQ